MVAGYHLIWTLYGFWLPNDIRGSTSKMIRVDRIKTLGEIHFGRKKVQPSSQQIREFFDEARDVLWHPVLTLDDDDIVLLGKVFGEVIADCGYTCYACAIMPDHVHMLIRRHRDKAEQMIENFQVRGRAALIDAGKRKPTHPLWTGGEGWKTFLNTRRDFEREIEYIRQNPLKIGRSEQHWNFIKPYDGWLPAYRD